MGHPTVASLIRRNTRKAGVDLSHVDDTELGARLAAMPLHLTDDPSKALKWLVYGDMDPHATLPDPYRRRERRRAAA